MILPQLLVLIGLSMPLSAVPEKIRLANGQTLEGVKAAKVENGQLKVAHAAGVGRYDLASVDPVALQALGLEVAGKASFPSVTARKLDIPAVPLLWSAKGKLYKNARAFTLENPSEISFTCDAGPVTKLRIDSLEPEARGQFGYDPEKAKEYDSQEVARAEAIKESQRLADERSKVFEAEMAVLLEKQAKVAAIEAKKQAIKDKHAAVAMLYNTTYGTESYWMKPARDRELYDALTTAWLSKQGLTPSEIRQVMQQARYR